MTRPGAACAALSIGGDCVLGSPFGTDAASVVRPVAVVDVLDDRRETIARMMPCSTPTTTTVAAVTAATANSPGRSRVDVAHAREVDQPDADQEDDRGQHGVRHVRQRAGQEQQDDDDDRGRGQLRELAPAAGAVDHLGLGRAAVDHERAADAGADVGQAQADEVDVLVEAVVVLHGVGARRRGALGEDDDERSRRRSAGGPRRCSTVMTSVGRPDGRQAARDGPERR